jgi:hypothetical protein
MSEKIINFRKSSLGHVEEMHNAIGQKSVMKGWREQLKKGFWSLKKLTVLIQGGGGGGGGSSGRAI